MYFVYMLECEDGSYYTGITTDVARRFEEHCAGTGGRYTRAKKPVKIVYSEQQPDRSAASKREAEIKQLSRQKKALIIRSEQRKNREGRHRGGSAVR